MADERTKPGQQDRSRVAGDKDDEARPSAKRDGIDPDAARGLIRTHGSNREELDRAAAALKPR